MKQDLYHVIRLSTGRPINDDRPNNPQVFKSGKEAADVAAEFSRRFGEKYQPRRIKVEGENWRDREAARFRSGEYYPVPWDSASWWHGTKMDKEHFAHISIETDAMIAFTPDDESGERDRQVRVSPGKYLTKYAGKLLDEGQIQQIASDFSVQYKQMSFGLATTAKDIREVYEKGPHSCMAAHRDAYQSGKHHPTEAYAGPDLAVAYLLNDVKTVERGGSKYSARCLVWPDKKIYGRLYGDSLRLRTLLEKAGYKQGDFNGARLNKVPLQLNQEEMDIDLGDFDSDEEYEAYIKALSKKAYLMPYIDNHRRAKIEGKHIIIDNDGYLDTGVTCGYTVDARQKCPLCKELIHPNRFTRVLNHEGEYSRDHVCNHCRDTNFVATTIGDYAQREDVIQFDDWAIHRRHRPEYYIVLDSITGAPLWRQTARRLTTGEWVSSQWFTHSGKYCDYCGGVVRRHGQEPCKQYRDRCPFRQGDLALNSGVAETSGHSNPQTEQGVPFRTITAGYNTNALSQHNYPVITEHPPQVGEMRLNADFDGDVFRPFTERWDGTAWRRL